MAAVREEASTRRFVNALIKRSNPFTYLFIGINLGMFALLWLAGGMDLMGADGEALLALGAKQNELIDQGQYWRFVTSMFLHIGFIHLFFNNYALWIVGQEIERLYGSARFVAIYLLTGLAGSVASYFYKPEATSAGASGAIFGLFGLLAVFAFRYRKEIPKSISDQIKRQVIPLIAINLGLGFLVKMVDNSAHLGGLFTGVLLGLLVPYKRPEEKKTPILWRALQIVGLAVIAVSFVSTFRHYDGPPLEAKNLMKRPDAGVKDYFNGMNQGMDAMRDAVQTFIEVSDKKEANPDISGPVATIDRAVENLDFLRPEDEEANQYKQRLRDSLTKQKSILAMLANEKPERWSMAEKEEIELIESYKKFREDYRAWLPGYLARYGLQVKEQPASEK